MYIDSIASGNRGINKNACPIPHNPNPISMIMFESGIIKICDGPYKKVANASNINDISINILLGKNLSILLTYTVLIV